VLSPLNADYAETEERETAVIRASHDGSEAAWWRWRDRRGRPPRALDANVAAARACREMPRTRGRPALRKVADGSKRHVPSRATLALEAGKPIAQAKTRSIAPFSCFVTRRRSDSHRR